MSEEVGARSRSIAWYIWVMGAVIAVVLGIVALLAPRLAPCFVVRHSPSYSQVFEVYCSDRCEAAFGRLEADGPHNIAFLGRMLTSPDVQRRRKVAMLLSLSDFQSRELIEGMAHALKDADKVVRVGIAVGLALRHASSALPTLIEARDAAVDDDERRQFESCIQELSPRTGGPLP